MDARFLAIIICSALLYGCEDFLSPDIPAGYPTTYNKLSNSELSQKRINFASRNQFLISSLNEFGFTAMSENLTDRETPAYNGDTTESDALSAAKEFVSKNTLETGVKNIGELDFNRKIKDTGYGGAIFWHFRTVNQKIDTIEVLYSEILIHLQNGKVTLCYGNWYPDIYLPGEFNFDQTKARSILIGKTVSHYSIAGVKSDFTISKKDLERTYFHLKILPKKYDDRIELRVCWQIYVPDVFYILYVDVMTGEIVSQEPTIIS